MTKRYFSKLSTWVEGKQYAAGQEVTKLPDADTTAALVEAGNLEEREESTGQEGVAAYYDVVPSGARLGQVAGVIPVDGKGKVVEDASTPFGQRVDANGNQAETKPVEPVKETKPPAAKAAQ